MLFSQHGVLVKSVALTDRKKYEGETIRAMMADNDPAWKNQVPKKVSQFLVSIDADKRIRKIIRMGG
jgi:nicotinamide mononucleotide adenylyltransferase